MTTYNYVGNPRFHANASDGWSFPVPAGWTVERDVAPPVALPSGADACLHIETDADAQDWQADILPAAGIGGVGNYIACIPGSYSLGFTSYGPEIGGGHANGVSIAYEFYDVGFAMLSNDYLTSEATSYAAFEEASVSTIVAPEDTAYVRLYLYVVSSFDDPVEREYWVTKVMFSNDPTYPGYGDGDLFAWEWYADPHDSISIDLNTSGSVPAEPPTAYYVTVGGRVMEHENFHCSEAEWGGFDTASFDVKSDPRRSEPGLRALEAVVAYFAGEVIFHGRVTDVSKEVDVGNGCVRRVSCRGKFDELRDDGALRRTIVDSDVSGWENDQIDTAAGSYDVVEDWDIGGGED